MYIAAFVLFCVTLTTVVGEETTAASTEGSGSGGETTAADATTAAVEGSGSGEETVSATTAGNYSSIYI